MFLPITCFIYFECFPFGFLQCVQSKLYLHNLDFNNRNAQISILNCGISCKLLTKNLSSERIIVFVCISLMPQYLMTYAYCESPREMEGIKNGMFSLADYDVVFVQEILIDQKK